MNPNLSLGIGILAAITAGLACVGAHKIARRRRWGYVPRYVTGIAIGLVALAFPLFCAMPPNDAVLAWGVTALIFVGEGLATWLAHDASPDNSTTPEADELIRRLDEELRK